MPLRLSVSFCLFWVIWRSLICLLWTYIVRVSIRIWFFLSGIALLGNLIILLTVSSFSPSLQVFIVELSPKRLCRKLPSVQYFPRSPKSVNRNSYLLRLLVDIADLYSVKLVDITLQINQSHIVLVHMRSKREFEFVKKWAK